MMLTDVLVGLAVAIGVLGVLVPVLPGSALVGAAVLVWAVLTATVTGWVVLALVLLLLAGGSVTKYAVPGRRLRSAGVSRGTLLTGGVLAVAGFFVVPVVGLPLGFVLGVFLAEWRRHGQAAVARTATVAAVRAIGLGVLVELGAASLAAVAWGVGVLLT